MGALASCPDEVFCSDMVKLLKLFGLVAKTTQANPLLTCGEDWLSRSHAISPPTLTTVWDESKDGEVAVNTVMNYTTQRVKRQSQGRL
jgi:hypothetical protein